ncbi:hypothetical protein HUT02_34435, partial [Pseudomonas protegens]|nr:hypothetical protein [Pseudomonas protegens]
MNLLFLTFVFPLIGFLLLSFSRGRLSENLSALIGVGSIGLSAIVAAYVIWQFNWADLPTAPPSSIRVARVIQKSPAWNFCGAST